MTPTTEYEEKAVCEILPSFWNRITVNLSNHHRQNDGITTNRTTNRTKKRNAAHKKNKTSQDSGFASVESQSTSYVALDESLCPKNEEAKRQGREQWEKARKKLPN